MASGKLPPRQKMINMMYLVLTALLALNVSKDILNAFLIVNEGIVKTRGNVEGKNEMIYNNFNKQLEINPAKVKPYYDKAMKVKELSKKMCDQIRIVRNKTILYTEWKLKEGNDKKVKIVFNEDGGKEFEIDYKSWTDPNSKEFYWSDSASVLKAITARDNYDDPMLVLLDKNNEVSSGMGEAIKLTESLKKYKEELLSLVDPKKRKDEEARWGINVEDYVNPEYKQKRSWAFNNFYHTVLAADVAILNKLIVDVKTAESQIIASIYSDIDAGDFKFDKISAKIIPKSNYVITGDKYEADIFVAAYSTTSNPEIVVGSGVDTVNNVIIGTPTPVEAKEGVGKYSVVATGEGERKYGGLIKIKAPDGAIKSYPFKGEYIVARPTATISPTKMNVFYIGVDNPVSISVPGVPAEKVYPSLAGPGTIVPAGAKGQYIVRVTTPGKVMVNVSAKVGETQKSMGGMEFRVKNVPDPVAKVANKTEGKISKSILLAANAVVAKLENFDFDLKFSVVSFSMSVAVGNAIFTKESRSAYFTPEMINSINGLNRGQAVYFESIKAKGPDGTIRNLNPIVFKIE